MEISNSTYPVGYSPGKPVRRPEDFHQSRRQDEARADIVGQGLAGRPKRPPPAEQVVEGELLKEQPFREVSGSEFMARQRMKPGGEPNPGAQGQRGREGINAYAAQALSSYQSTSEYDGVGLPGGRRTLDLFV